MFTAMTEHVVDCHETLGTDIKGENKSYDFGDPLTFPLVPLWGSHFCLTIGRTATKFDTVTHVVLGINCMNR